MSGFFSKEKGIVFAVGTVVGVVLTKFLQTETAKDLAVVGIAKGIMAKDTIIEKVANAKEQAEDIYAEAQELVDEVYEEYECECECECDCKDDENCCCGDGDETCCCDGEEEKK